MIKRLYIYGDSVVASVTLGFTQSPPRYPLTKILPSFSIDVRLSDLLSRMILKILEEKVGQLLVLRLKCRNT